VEPIVLRDEDPEDVVVVGAAPMESAYLRRTALDAYDEVGLYTVSVLLALDDWVDALCARKPYLLRYGRCGSRRSAPSAPPASPSSPPWPARTTTSYCPASPLLPSAGWKGCFEPRVPNPARWPSRPGR